MKKVIFVFVFVFVLVEGFLVSCSDKWDDHYQVYVPGQGTMWETITSDPDLSNFADVLEACGYMPSLDGSQVFTVFAPTNDQFTASQRDKVIETYQKEKAQGVKDKDNSAIKEFVQNHIALYNYSIDSQSLDTTLITMMNGKFMYLTGSKFADTDVKSRNIATSNGVLFTINKEAEYVTNVFEQLKKDSDFTHLANFLYSFNEYKFDADQSVKGEIIDGQQHYLDSVTHLTNDILDEVGDISDEDSTYWMVAPINDVWDTLIDEYSNYFIFDKTTKNRDSLMWIYPRLFTVMGTVFSRTQNPDATLRDSAMSTNAVSYQMRKMMYGSYDFKYYQYDKPYASGHVFDIPQSDIHTCSNGEVMKARTWNIDKSQTFLGPLVEWDLDSVYPSTRPLNYVQVPQYSEFYNQCFVNSYAEMAPMSSSAATALFDIPNVLSNVPYDVYLVMGSGLAGDTLVAENDTLPTVFRATVYYHDMEGKETNFKTTANITACEDPHKLDSAFIGTYTFPTCSYSTSLPQVKIKIENRVSNTQEKNKKYTRTMRLFTFIFKPHE